MQRTKRILEMASCSYIEGLADLNASTSSSIPESLQLSKEATDPNIYLDYGCPLPPNDLNQACNSGYIEVEPTLIQKVVSHNSLIGQQSLIFTTNQNSAPIYGDVDDNIIIEELQPVPVYPSTELCPTSQQAEKSITTDCENIWDNDNASTSYRTSLDKDWTPSEEIFNEDNGEDENSGSDEEPVRNDESLTSHEEVQNIRKRKRKPDPKTWKRNKIINLRQNGREYKSLERKAGAKGAEVLRNGRKMGPTCTSNYCLKSKKRFCASIDDNVREQLFGHFWKELSWDDRKSYVTSLVDCVVPKQKRREESGDRRGATFHYHLKVANERKEVCRDMFCNTLSIGVWSVKNWASSAFHGMRSKKLNSDENIQVTPTRRGVKKSNEAINQTRNINNTIPVASHTSFNTKKRENAEAFIDLLPKLESHYCRRDSAKLYLEPIFQSQMELYRLYLEHCRDHNEKSVSRFTFTDILDSKNISLFVPRKDQCDICCQHVTGNLSDEAYNAHIQAKDKARAKKDEDKKKAILKECVVFTVDVQAVKLSPALKASSLYYKTKLCCHNYTIFNLATNEVDCYWWHEGEGELKASSFTSCLIYHLQKTIDAWSLEMSKKEIIIWSDGCGYQNKNKTLSNALAQLSMKTGFTIEQKFLHKGHTQMEVDSVHASIEKRLKNRSIYLPEDYITVTKEARIKTPYQAHNLKHSFFLNYTIIDAELYSSIRPGNKVNDPTINLVCHFKYTPEGLIHYRLDFEEELTLLPRRPSSSKEFIYPSLYNSSLKIKKK